jgi:signal transduction histidine kinase
MGAVELLQAETTNGAGMLDDLVDMIGASSQRMLAMVNNLLDLARMESGKITLDLQPLALPDLLAECLHALQPVAQIAGVTSRLEAPGGLPEVVADSARLYQVFINLIGNAIKFTGEGGSVTVTCAVLPPDRVRVSIRDTGPGIAPEIMPRLFTRFTQISAPAKRQRRGSGLGLYITRQLVDLHNGAIEVESVPGCGATFGVILPIQPPGANTAAQHNFGE